MMLEVRVYLGYSIPDGGRVYDCEMRDFLRDVVDKEFQGYTEYYTNGVWTGEVEQSLVLEFICDEFEYPKAVQIAKRYKEMFRQEAVLVTRKELLGSVLV